MNSKSHEPILRKLAVLLLAVAVPVLVWSQKKTESKPSAPAKPAAQSHTSTPAAHSNPNSPGHGNTTQRPGTPAGTSHTGTPANSRTGNTAMGSRPGTGTTTGHPGTMNAGTGTHALPGRQVSLRGGGTANVRPNGSIRSVNRNGMQINRGMHGGRTVVSTHNGARVVSTGRGGYVQRAYFARGGRTYVSRTYVVNNVTYTSVYRSYGYGGYCCYYGYAPAYYWHPAYYGWAYNPWPAPVYYGWGWNAEPWYGYYGPYYAPYPVYPSAYFWVTDWMIAASLRAAYLASVQANLELSPLAPDPEFVASLGAFPVPDDAKVTLTKEVKDQLAEEVKTQLGADQAEAGKSGNASAGSSGGGGTAGNAPPPALDPKWKTFVVNDEVSTDVDGQECSLTTGDVISRASDTPDADRNVDVKVLASKKGDCAVGAKVSVSLDDLQEMHNHFREQISGGMEELSKKQGSGGLPKAPDTGKQDGEVPAPPADTTAAKTLKDQQAAADQAETEVKQEAGNSGSGTGGGQQ